MVGRVVGANASGVVVRRNGLKRVLMATAATVGGLLIPQMSSAHTDALGFVISPDPVHPGKFITKIYYGTYDHGGTPSAEGSAQIALNNLVVATQPFALVPGYSHVANGTVPSDLVLGTNYFFVNSSTSGLGTTPFSSGTNEFQFATFDNLDAGNYTFGYVSGPLTQQWTPLSPAINAGSFTVTSAGTLGGIGGVVTTPDIDTALAVYTTTQLAAGSVTSNFAGGTLQASTTQAIATNFKIGAAGGTIDTNNQTLTLNGTLSDQGATPGKLTVKGGGTVVATQANTYSGGTYVDGGVLRLTNLQGAGTGTIHLVDPQIDLATAGTNTNAYSLDVKSPAVNDPSIFNNSSGGTVVLAGAITTGTGNNANGQPIDPVQYVTFAGSGTTQLTNTANSWTGTTTVNSGATLQGTNATISGSSIVDNGTLAYVQAGSGTVAQGISGSGAVTVSGLTAGNTLTFGGALATTGGTTVTGTSNVAINGGANGGIVENGAGNRTLTIASNATNTTASSNGSGLFVQTTSGTTTVGVNAGATLATTTASGNNQDGITALTNAAITNNGTISSSYNAGVALAGGGSVTNNGTITGGNGGNGYGIAVSNGSAATITLNTASKVSGMQGGVAFQSTGTGANAATLSNAGQITSTRYGVEASAAGAPTVTNLGTGKIVGTNAGIFSAGTIAISNAGTIGTGTLDASGNFTVGGAGFALQFVSGAVTNTGILNSTGASVYQTSTTGTLNLVNTGTIGGAARAIDPDDTVVASGAGTVLNSGTITTPSYYAVSLLKGGTVTNAAAGVISAGTQDNTRYGVDIAGGSGTINNYGIIRSTSADQSRGIVTDNNAATINLYAGSTTGAITTGSAADALTLYTGRGTAAAATTTTYLDAVSGATGMMTLQQAGTLAAASVGAINLGGGANTLTLRGTGDGQAANGVGGSLSLSTVAINGALTKQDTGTWTLTGTGNAGLTQINAGVGGTSGSGGLLVFGGTGLTSAIAVNGATIRADVAGGFGTGTITATDPTIQYNATGTYANAIVLASTDSTNDPTRLQVGDAVTATITGQISQGGGSATQPLIFELIPGGVAGTFVLTNGANTYNGLTTINTGTTVIERSTASALGTGGVTIASGATLQLDNQTGGQLYLEGGTYAGAGTLAFSASAPGATAVGYGGNGNTIISLASGGLIDVRSGTVQGSSSGQGFWTGNKGDLSIAAGATFDGVEGAIIVDALNGAGTLRGGYGGTGSTTIGIDDGSGTFSGTIANSSDVLKLTKQGTGTQTLTGANTYTGATTISGGTLALGGTGTLTATTITDNATFDIAGHTGGASVLNLLGSGATTLGVNTLTITAANGTYAGSFTGTGGLTVNGGGTYVLTGTGNSYAGATTIGAGETLQGQTSTISGSSIIDNGVLAYNQTTAAGTVAQTITGGGALTKTGAQTVTLTGTDTYTGGTTVNQGTLALGNGGAGGSIAGNVALTNNAVLQINRSGNPTVANAVSGTGTVQVSANAVLTGAVTASNGVNIDTGVVAGVGTVTATDNEAVALATGATVNVAGTVSSTGGYGVYANTGGTITIGQSGIVYGSGLQAIYAGAAIQLDNAGLIQTTSTGNSGIIYGAQAAGTTSNLVNRATGQIIGMASGINALNAAAGTIAIVNEQGGRISGANTAATLITASSVNNAGTMVGGTGGVTTTATTTIVNSGLIGTGTLAANGTYTAGGSGPAIQIATGGSSVTNTGTVNGGTRGLSLTGTGTYAVVNSGTGTILGRGDTGITDAGVLTLVNGTGATIQAAVNAGVAITGSATVYNGGALTGGNNTTNGYGFQSNTANAVTLNNYGTATGGVGGIVAVNTGAVTANLYAGSTTGAIALGAAADTLTLYTGTGTANAGATYNTATGLVEAAATSDATHVLLQTAGTQAAAAFGPIDLGGGMNTLALRGAGDGSAGNGVAGAIDLSTVANVATITKQDAGSWTLMGAATASTAGATINAGTGAMLSGEGNLIFAGSGLTGTIYVNGAVAQATGTGTLGTGTVHLVDPTLVFATASATYANAFVLDVARPGQGSPSDTSNDPSTFQANAGVTATLTGTITTGTGNNVNGYAIDPVQPVVIAGAGTVVLTNAGNAWTGMTTVNAGATLQGTTASLSGGSFADNGTLNFSQTAAGTSARAIGGTGVVQVNGGGNVALTGAITTAGGVQVGAGGVATLSNVSGSAANAVTFTDAGATLNVVQGGTVGSANGYAVTGNAANNTVNNAGTLTGNANYAAIALNATTGTDTVTNTGTISGYNGVFSGATLVLTNAGTVTGQTAQAVYGSNAGSSVTNSGTITGGTAATTTSAVALIGGGTVTNTASGIITGNRAVNIINAAGTVINAGQITGLTSNGVQIVTGTVTNQAGGTISAAGIGVQATAAGATIDNSGTIQGSASGAIGVAMAGGTLTNRSGGVISAGQTNGVYGTAIQLTGMGNVLNLQAGSTVNGRIDASGTTDATNSYTFTGTLNGGFTGGSGNDTVTLVTPVIVTGTLDGGAGTDTLVLDGTAAGSLGSAQVLNFENGVKQGSGTWTLTGTTAASPTAFAINAGTLAVAGGNALADLSAVTIASGATLALSASETIGSLNGAGAVVLGANTLTTGVLGANATFAGVASGTGGLTKVGTGTLTVSGSNTYTGATTVNAGTLALGASNVLADASAVGVATGATLALGANSDTVASLALAGTLSGTGTLTAATYTLNGAAVNGNLGAGTLTQAGGTSVLSGTAAATTVAVNAGTLTLGASDRLADAAAVSVATGAVLNLAGFTDTVGTAALNGTVNGTGTLTAATYTLNGAAVNGNLGTGTLTQAGGTSVLTGSSAALTVAINAGTLRLGASDRLADAGAVTVATGAVLDLGAFTDTVGTAALNGTVNGTGTLTAATYTLNGAAVNGNLGAGTLTQAGGTSVLSGTSAALTVAINAGTLRTGANERLADAGAVTVATGATLDLAGATETVGSVNGAGAVALGAGRLVLAGAGASSLGALTGTGNVDKTGTGALTLANAYAATGSINLLAGTTAFTGTSAGALRVAGGTLTGTGMAAGGLTLTAGTVAPGTAASPFGTLTVGSLSASGGTYAVDFGGVATGYAADLIRVNGAAALSGTVAVAPTSFVGNERFQQTYTIVQANSLTGTFANGAAFTATPNDPSLYYRLRYDLVANAVVLQVQRQIDFAAALAGTGTANQTAVAGALNGTAGTASDAYAATLNAIAAAGNRGATLDSLSGEAIADINTSALFAAEKFTDLLQARLGLDGGGAVARGQYALRAGMNGALAHASGLAGSLGQEATADATANATGAGFWMQGFGAQRRLEGREPNEATTRSFAGGLAGGLDGRIGAFTVGAGGGFTHIDTTVDARASTVEGQLYQGGAYAGYDTGAFYLGVSGTYYGGDVTTVRQLTIGTARIGAASGRTNAHGYDVSGLAGVRFALGSGTQAAFQVSGAQTRATKRGYTETAPSGLALQVARDTRNLFTGEAELRLSHELQMGGATVTPYASAGVRVYAGDLQALDAMQLTGAPTGAGGFIVQGAKVSPVMGTFTGGLELKAADRFRIDLSAGSALANRTREGQVKVTARIGF